MQAHPPQVHPVPVLIVGGGLVGLSAALLLAHQGVRALVIEKHAGTSLHPRARGFHARTVELLRSTCAGEEVERAGAVPAGTVVGHLVAVTLAGPVHSWKTQTVSTQRMDLSPCPMVFLGQDRLEPILLKAARSLGVEVRFRHELTGFTQDAEGVRATVLDRDTGAVSIVHAAYLIGADGVRSPVREALGIGQKGRGSFGHNISTLFEADLSPVQREVPLGFAVLTHPEVGGVIAATDVKDRWIHATRLDVSRETAADFTEARWTQRLRTVTGIADLMPTFHGTFVWEAAERVAERFSSGRVFLAGDAAHQMPPTGGFGANTGIHDAANLAWKLAAVLNGHAGPALLETYDAERRPVAAATANQAGLLALKMAKQELPTGEELFEDDAVTLGYRYGDGPPLPRTFTPTGEPGTRAPHVWLDGAEERKSTLDLFGSGFVLLAGSEAWRGTGRMPLRIHEVQGWQHAYGVGDAGACLVRPDGMVAARWSAPVPDAAQVVNATLEAQLFRAELQRGARPAMG
ncbi:FAD-dependent monooxygenase [Corallococcus aberystwythensis]|uniref:FAD-binding protein n=1 Tax=Corallococcus aberystwythensis TaxID=2316722 RepID=A0A3A8PSH8_9BACT|nr:FAD-dependent monooxygenase [Corallococcus aberystwythensis]RKH59417.1 FAD-binding protein [Corallococcus aberystwythensis]